MTHEMNPASIIDFGRAVRGALDEHPTSTVVARFSPGNMTVYELTFTPLAAVAGEFTSPGEYPALASISSEAGGGRAVLVAKTNGATWAWWLGLDNGYLDPDYVRQRTNGASWGDVGPLGLMLNGLRLVPRADLDASPYLIDGALDFSLGGRVGAG